MEDETLTLTSGQMVAGRFRLQKSLGAGAMGAVFSAIDERTGDARALKVVHPHVAKAGVNAERFRREVTLVQQVGHPGIVRVFDAGRDPDIGLFMVMELLKGVTFKPPLMQGDLTVAQALEIVGATLHALHAAHAQGIVHRDLKPDNIFLHAPEEGGPQVKLLDFGVARQLNAAGITTTNVGLGTPHFMAPEQATDARSVTAASDVWSAGVMLYYILCGALPFDGDGPYDTVLKACTVPHAPLDKRAPDVDYRLVDIVETCLEKDPEERFQDAGEVYEVLAPLLADRKLGVALSSQAAAEPRSNAHIWADHGASWNRSNSGVFGSATVASDDGTPSSVGYASTEPARQTVSTGTRPSSLPIAEPSAASPQSLSALSPSPRLNRRLTLTSVAAIAAAVVGLAFFAVQSTQTAGVVAVESIDFEQSPPPTRALADRTAEPPQIPLTDDPVGSDRPMKPGDAEAAPMEPRAAPDRSIVRRPPAERRRRVRDRTRAASKAAVAAKASERAASADTSALKKTAEESAAEASVVAVAASEGSLDEAPMESSPRLASTPDAAAALAEADDDRLPVSESEREGSGQQTERRAPPADRDANGEALSSDPASPAALADGAASEDPDAPTQEKAPTEKRSSSVEPDFVTF